MNITNSIEEARVLLANEKNISSALRVSIELILTLVTLIVNKKGLNSKNSSIPPSQDPNREKESRAKGKRKVGGQKGHKGTTLKAVEKPDEIKIIKLDKRKLPKGEYRVVGYDKRQVFDIDISTIVTEYYSTPKIKTRKKQNSFKEHFSFKNKKVKKAFSILDKEPKEYALGHNDLHARNIIFYKTSIKLIDWEYTRYSDIYFDLVSIMIEYKLNTKDSNTFLRSYFGRKKINRKKLKAFTIIYKALWRLWFEKLAKGEL